jgi:hypothetical protein
MTRLRKITFSAKVPPHTRAEGGQVEPVLGASARFKLPADVYGQDLVFCIPLFCMIRSRIQM